MVVLVQSCYIEIEQGFTRFTFSAPISKPLELKKVTYLFRKPKAIPKKLSNQNWKSFIHSVSKLVRMKKPLFIRTSFDAL